MQSAKPRKGSQPRNGEGVSSRKELHSSSRFFVSTETSGRTMHHTVLEGPLNCLTVNKDCSQVVVAGRNVFKIFSIEDQDFQEKINLRVGRNINLNYSASDVAWNPVNDNFLASAATNGAVVVWDLNRLPRSKQDHVFTNVHKRFVNKVVFHVHECDMLLSGSQDGYMKLFDLRKRDVSSSFYARDGVRDIQYNPAHYFTFAAALENGNIQIWDMRNTSRWESQFTAHNGPVFSIDWHPDEKMWIGTAGRDRIIKVWDLQQTTRPRTTHTVQTIASVAKIKWRPQRKYHISSCSLLLDFSVNVWDIRRPYIPFAAFNEHKDCVTGIVWKHNDPHVFYSSSKDATIYQHMFRDATRPANDANPVSLSINVHGNLAYASSDKLSSANSKPISSYWPEEELTVSLSRAEHYASRNNSYSRFPAMWKRTPDRSEQFTVVTSILNEFQINPVDSVDEDFSMEWFITSAENYKLTGRSISELCEHNALVADGMKRHQVAQTWRMLKLLYSEKSQSATKVPNRLSSGEGTTTKDAEVDRAVKTEGRNVQETKAKEGDSKEKYDTSTGMSDEDSDGAAESENPTQFPLGRALSVIASGHGNKSHSDFFFGDGDIDQTSYEFDNHGNMQDGQEWSLPNEAFEPRHEIEETSQPIDPLSENTRGESPSSANESEMNSKTQSQISSSVQNGIKHEILGAPPFMSQMPVWHFTGLVVDMLHSYAEKGDVQMAVTAIIVLGDRIKPHLEEVNIEQWFMSYIDLLGRFEMWSRATEIIKLSGHPAVGALNQQSTTIHTHCSRCSKQLLRSGWVCDRCKGQLNICSICHLPVRGLYAWCQGCSHGGHLHHIQEWLKSYKHCPTGCGHDCEYT